MTKTDPKQPVAQPAQGWATGTSRKEAMKKILAAVIAPVVVASLAGVGIAVATAQFIQPRKVDVSPLYKPSYKPNELAPRRTVVTVTVTVNR